MGALNRQELRELYRLLYLTRALEERLERLFKQGHIQGGLYRSLGQEATAVGSAYALEDGDWLAPAIRDVGALFARGLPPEEMLRQYTCRGDALTGGKDTTTHFNVGELGLLGPISSLGTQLCVLNGIAHRLRTRDSDRICLTYQGEGGSRTGAFHEGLNFAAVQRLPVVVILEHNRWAFSTRSDGLASVDEWTDMAGAYGVPARQVDGNDVLEVYDTTLEAVERARRGEGVTLIVAETYRMLGHAQHDPQNYVPEEELEEWRRRDPLARFAEYLTDVGLESGDDLERLRAEVDRELDRAVEATLRHPPPDPEEARTDVYARAPESVASEASGAEPAAPVPWTRRDVVGYRDLPAGISPAPIPGD